jgi:hypothetical protein
MRKIHKGTGHGNRWTGWFTGTIYCLGKPANNKYYEYRVGWKDVTCKKCLKYKKTNLMVY